MTSEDSTNLINFFIKSWEITGNSPAFVSLPVYIRGNNLEDLLLEVGEYVEIELCDKKRTAKLNYAFVFSGLATKNCVMPIYGIYKIWLSI